MQDLTFVSNTLQKFCDCLVSKVENHSFLLGKRENGLPARHKIKWQAPNSVRDVTTTSNQNQSHSGDYQSTVSGDMTKLFSELRIAAEEITTHKTTKTQSTAYAVTPIFVREKITT